MHRGPDGTAATLFGKDAIASAAALQTQLAPALDRLLAARVDHLRATARRAYVVVGLGIALAAYLFLAFFIAMTRSVRRMVVTADAIAEGDLEQDLGVRSRDEIGALAQAFERMVAYLREAADAAGRIARGDLTVQPTPRSERDVFGTAFATMAGQLRALVGRLSGSATRLGVASQQMAADLRGGRPRRRGDRHRDGGHVERGARAGRHRRAHARRWPRRWPAPRAPRPTR